MDKVAFPSSEVAQASFSIEPKYGQIDLYMRGSHIGSVAEPVTNITISMNVPGKDYVYKTINSNFIGTDIARTADIPTKTSQLTNDSNFVTSAAIPTNYVTTDTEQTITGKKVFGTLQATSLTDGTTTKTMTEVLAGGGGGSNYTFTDGLVETNGVVKFGYNDDIKSVNDPSNFIRHCVILGEEA